MKLLFYSPVKLSTGGGCERWHCDITNSLKENYGHIPKIITGNLGDNKWSNEYLGRQLKGIPYQKLQYPIFFGVLIPTPKIIYQIYKQVIDVDAVHFIYGFLGQDILMLLIKMMTGKKIVVGHHAPTFHSSTIHNLYIKYISRFVMSHFDFHMTLNSHDKKYFENRWKINNVYFIPSGVKIERFFNVCKLPHKTLNFLSVGRYEVQKGFDMQLEAIKLFNNKYPKNKAKFYFVGGGTFKELIQDYTLKCPNVYDLGYIEYENISRVYAQSDIYLLCSREEPFGLVLIEAWASGVPVLATKTEGPSDMLNSGKNGWLIDEISISGIFKSLVKIYNIWNRDHKTFLTYSQNCRNTAMKYSINTTAEKMHSLFFTN